jgi:hypothetical protein
MIYKVDQIREDFSPFADLGTYAPIVAEVNDHLVLRLIRNGTEMELSFHQDGYVNQRQEGSDRRYSSINSVLANEDFADLRKWADSQQHLLRGRVERETIPVIGQVTPGESEGGVDKLDEVIAPQAAAEFPRVLITLIDGPAGIGKTSLIRLLAYNRAKNYKIEQRPLILHVESRGRMLQNVTDLMAFSLQTLRLPITYDQVPTLIRNGLITLAIDGFDELGDPSGYELAWAQVNELIKASRGRGTLILAGRETFIGRERLATALNAIDENRDKIISFSVLPIQPAMARDWLCDAGWNETTLASETVQPLLERGSYALRPFFLSELAREGVEDKILEGKIEDLLSFLINAMIEREAGKFGEDINTATSVESRKDFIEQLMWEVARDLAENQSDALPEDSVGWLAEVVAADKFPEGLVGILKNRANVIAFLTRDDRRGYLRFVHGQILNFFLSKVTVSTITQNEVPKFVRRNIFGVEFLENFSSVVRHLPEDDVNLFIERALEQIRVLGDSDRSRRNLASLVMAACGVFQPNVVPVIADVGLDEAYMTETLSHMHLNSVTIAQLNVRQADLREVIFDPNCHIVSLVTDETFIPPPSFPTPNTIDLPGRTLTKPDDVSSWLSNRRRASLPFMPDYEIAATLSQFPLFDLMLRVARYRPYWLKEGEDRSARRILEDPNWERLRGIMEKHDLLVERTDVQASGRPGLFYHVKNRPALLRLDSPPSDILPFLVEVLETSISEGHSGE